MPSTVPSWHMVHVSIETRVNTAQTHGPPLGSRYLSYSTMFADMSVLVSSVESMTNGLKGDQDPNNFGAMVKIMTLALS